MEDALSRTRMLIGEEALELLARSSVLVCGLGGVGSFVAEALVRSGIGRVGLIDSDQIDTSNLNRQLPALTSTLGLAKVSVVAQRLKEVNPGVKLEVWPERLTPDNLELYLDNGWDYVADAIDDTPAKVALLAACYRKEIPIISSMGAGNKLDPTQVRVADISKTFGCPLAKSMRRNLKALGIFAGIKSVFSPEEPPWTRIQGRTPASMIFVPGTFGLTIASEIIRDITGLDKKKEGS